MKDDQHDQAGVDHQLGHLGDAADVLHPVGVGEAEVAVEAVADVVAVEQVGVAAHARCSFFSTRLAMVDLPAPERPVNHSTQASGPSARRAAGLLTSSACQWMFCARRSAKCEHAGADGVVGDAVDQDEAAGVAVVRRRDRRRSAGRGCRLQTPISLSSSVARRQVLQRVDVDLVLERARPWRSRCAVPILSRYGRPGSIGSSAIQTIVASNWSATSAGGVGRREHDRRALMSISSARVRVIDWPATACAQVAVGGDDARDRGSRPEGSTRTRVARRARCRRRSVPAKPRKSRLRAVDPLHRHAERRVAPASVSIATRLQMLQQRRPAIPGHVRRCGSMTLSPRSAESGIAGDVAAVRCCAANAR